MTCPDCARTAADLAAARDELAAWRALGADQARAEAEAERLAALREAFGLSERQARVLARLIGRAPRVCRNLDLAETILGSLDDDRTLDVVKVVICHLRAALRARGLAGAVGLAHGEGYRLEAWAVAAIEARLAAGDGA